jgi:hypothetical protein
MKYKTVSIQYKSGFSLLSEHCFDYSCIPANIGAQQTLDLKNVLYIQI